MAGDFTANVAMRAVIKGSRQPVILFQQPPAENDGDICTLRQDDFEGGRLLCEHIVERGARALVALVPELDWPAMQARVAGIRHYLEMSKSTAKLAVVTSADESSMATQAALDAYLRDGGACDAVLAGNDQMAIAAHRLLTRRGLSIPGQVQLAGFNGFDFLDYFPTRLTTVRSPAHELGELGAYHMVKRIETGRFDSPSIVLPVSLMNGATT